MITTQERAARAAFDKFQRNPKTAWQDLSEDDQRRWLRIADAACMAFVQAEPIRDAPSAPYSTEHRMARIRRFPRSSNMSDLIVTLHGERFHGNLTMTFNRGICQTLTLEDTQIVPTTEALDRVVG